ncbi:hypothetical protein Ac2012v2_001752 [Leucoagaricus gongylophorus]
MTSSFQPTRASPPLRSTKPIHGFRGPPSIDFSVISSSTVIVPELLNLTPDDIEFIEAVIKRAGPFAATFPLVFKAYNDVLKERGMDAGEVKYYGKLLKLGTMKGKNWGEKWNAVQKYHPQPKEHPRRIRENASPRVDSHLAQEMPAPALLRLQDIDVEISDLDEDQRRSITPTPTKGSGNFLPTPASNNRFSVARRGLVNSRGQSSTDEDDVWDKIRMQQLEAEADQFREERLLGRCWGVWVQSYRWIMAQHTRVDQVRSALLLRLAFHHWRSSFSSLKAINEDVIVLDNERRICAFLNLWKKKLREKQQAKWQADMRNKMDMIRDCQSRRMLRKAWSSWGQKYRSAFANQQYKAKILLVAYLKWKGIFQRVDKLEGRAEHLVVVRDERLLLRCWESWRVGALQTRTEKEMNRRVQARVVWQAWSVWRRHTYDYRRVNLFRDRCLKNRFLSRWRTIMQNIGVLDARAAKHSARRDKILMCAILRVWLAHVRGKEVNRQRNQNLLSWSFLVWKKKVAQNRQQEELAAIFYQKTSIRVISTTLLQWQTVCILHRNAYEAASRFYVECLVKKTGLLWLSRFREGVEERKRQKLVKKLQDRQAARVLYRWLLLTRKRRRCVQAELLIQERLRQRLGRNAISHWTQRVISMRERELHAIETYNLKLERDAWTMFNSSLMRHKETLKLLEDHLAFKKEGKDLFHALH